MKIRSTFHAVFVFVATLSGVSTMAAAQAELPMKVEQGRPDPAARSAARSAARAAALAARGAVTQPSGQPSIEPTTNASTNPTTGNSTNPSTNPATGPATGPTTTASTQPVEKPFPEEFAALLKRSPFTRGAPTPPAPLGAPASPEATFGLRGVGMQDGQFIALVENIAAKGVQRLKEGDSIAAGKVKAITLEGLVYEAAGKSTPVAIGQNLLGAALPPQPPPPPKPPAQPQGQPGQPGQPGGQPGQPGQPGGPQPGMRLR